MAELDIDIQSFDIPRLVTVYPDRAGVRWWTNIEKDAWLEEFFPRQMEVYHNAIEQTKEQLLKQINI